MGVERRLSRGDSVRRLSFGDFDLNMAMDWATPSANTKRSRSSVLLRALAAEGGDRNGFGFDEEKNDEKICDRKSYAAKRNLPEF